MMPSPLPFSISDTAQRLELEHGWEFLPDPTGRLQLGELPRAIGWRAARVGLSWNAQFEDLRDYLGAAWYRTRFIAPQFNDTRHVLLKFGAVDYFCEVYLNGVTIGRHEGGYTPFSFDITSAVQPGENELTVRVIDPPMEDEANRAQFPDMMYNEIPHGKQNWYVQNGGIWQGVRVEYCPAIYVDRVDVTPQISGKFQLEVKLAGVGLFADAGSVAAQSRVRVSVYETARKVFETVQPIAGNVLRLTGEVQRPKLWGPDQPALYTLEVAIEGRVRYARRVRFGFRSFEAQEGKLYLNGEPFYMVSALDQDFYPETIHSPSSVEVVRDMMLKAKRMGINVLRCHLKVAHPVYLDTADELGLLVWAELPSWSDSWFPSDHFSLKAALRGQQMFEEMLARDWNHPCIVVQTIMNESWGINLQDAEQRAWLRNTFDRISTTLKPLGRLVVDNSACEKNFHIKTDIEDFHQYYSMPDQRDAWDKWLGEFSSRPAWTFSPFGDAERTGKEPLLVSEFGNWGLPELPDELPWWFHRNFGDREATNPSGVLERFYEYKLDSVFADYNEFARESQWHQFASLKYEIESIRRRESVNGYVITGMTDVHWEANGLLDMWRNPKVSAEEICVLQQPDVVLCDFGGVNYFAGEAVKGDVFLSHFSRRELKGSRVQWSTESGESGTFVIASNIAQGSVAHIGNVKFTAPNVEHARVERLTIEVRSASGARIMENSYDLYVFPEAPLLDGTRLALNGMPEPFATKLHERGYECVGIADRLAGDAIAVSSRIDEEMAAHLRNGGAALILVDSEDALPGSHVKPKTRAGNELDGRWFSNYNWIRPDSIAFRELAFSRILGFESEAVVPKYVLRGLASADFHDVLCGATYAWLNLNSAIAMLARVNGGTALLTTFRFDHYGSDPYATRLFEGLVAQTAAAARSHRNPEATTVA